MYRFHICYLLTVAVCLLGSSLIYFNVFQVTVYTVCIAFGITTVFIAYNLLNGNGTHVPLTSHLDSFPADGDLVGLRSSGTNRGESSSSDYSSTATVTRPVGLRRPGAITNDKAYSSRANSAGSGYFGPSPGSILGGQQRLERHGVVTNGRTRLLPDGAEPMSNGVAGHRGESSPCATTDHNTVPIRHVQQQIPLETNEYIPVQTSNSEHLNSRCLSEEITTANVYLGGNFLPQSIIEDRQNKSPSISPTNQLPKFRRHAGSDNTIPELFPHADQVSRSPASEIIVHPTHQQQFGSLGILPLVHLPTAPRAFSNTHSSRPLNHGLVTVKIAPPDPLIAPVQFIRSENESPPNPGSTSCLTNDLNALREKRKRNAQSDETLEPDTSLYQHSNKRRKLDDSVESVSSSSPPVVTSGSSGMNLKRPALTDLRSEVDFSKHRRLQPYAVPSSTSQPGASARNPVHASYTSSERWLNRKAASSTSICQKTSQSRPAETEPQSAFRHRSRTSEIIQKSFSEGQMMSSDDEEQHFPSSPCESSLTIVQPSSSRNSTIYAPLDKGQPDDNTLNLSKRLAKKDQLSNKANLPTSSFRKLEGYLVKTASYKAHFTIEDVEKDRQKEMERVNYMLGEASDLVMDADPGQPEPCVVLSSAPVTPSLPQAATSGLQPASVVPSVAGSLSPSVENLPICTTAPSVQLQTSASATVVCKSPSSLLESAIPSYDLPNSVGPSSLHSKVPSAANPNPPVSLNSESMRHQSYGSTSAASVMLMSPEITTFASPTSCAGGLYGGFKFDLLASSTTPLSGFPATSSSVSNTVGGFKFEPGQKAVSAMGSFRSSQCITAGEKVPEIASTESRGSHLPALTKSSVVSASTNLAAVFGFGQTTSEPALSLGQPQTSEIDSTSATSLTHADDSVFKSATSVSAVQGSAVQFKPVFTTISQNFGNQSSSMNKMPSADFLNTSRNAASEGSENPSSMKTSFSGMFGSSASKLFVEGNQSSTLNSTTSSSVNPFAFGNPLDGNSVTGISCTSKGFLPRVGEKNQSLVNTLDSQQALVSNSVLVNQQKSSSDAGNQPMPEQGLGACTTFGIAPGAQPGSGINFGNQPSLPFSFGIKPAVTNSFSIVKTTAILFDNQSTPVNSVLSTSVASLNSLGNSKTSIFSFNSPTSVNNSVASILSFNNPTSVKSLGISQASSFPFGSPTYVNISDAPVLSFSSPTSVNSLGISQASLIPFGSTTSVNLPSNSEASILSFNNPTSVKSLSSPEASFSNPASLNLIGSVPQATGQFANQINNSASGFGGLPSRSDIFGNPVQTSFNPYGKQQMASFKFGTTTPLGNVFGNQTTSTLSFGSHSAATNMFGNLVGDQVTQSGGFGSSFGASAPSSVVEPKTLFSSPSFSQAQFLCPSSQSGGLNNSSVLNPAFQFRQNPETTCTVTSTQTSGAPSPFSFGQSSSPSFTFAQNTALGFQQLPNNSPTMEQGQQFPSQLDQPTPPQPPFASQMSWTPRFSIGTDNSNSAKNRSSVKNRMRRKP